VYHDAIRMTSVWDGRFAVLSLKMLYSKQARWRESGVDIL
jgi:hypothetical protein